MKWLRCFGVVFNRIVSREPLSTSVLQLPQVFKGIALFTPGGDLVYCIDEQKKARWHLHLCAALQDLLKLPEPPHFLVPCYTATLDRWRDPVTQQIKTAAEGYPLALRHQVLLNAVFDTGDLAWQMIRHPLEPCNPQILDSYREVFPQLWENHDLIVRFGDSYGRIPVLGALAQQAAWMGSEANHESGYVFRLYVSSLSSVTERILQSLHQVLDEYLQEPYTLKIVDVHKHPEEAEADQISATPTLIRVWPRPMKRVVGDLGNVNVVLRVFANNPSME